MASRLALAAGSALDATPHELVSAAAAAGFAAIGVRPPAELLRDHRALVELRRRLDDAGLEVHEVEVVRIGSTDDDTSALVEAAVVLRATAVLVVSDLPDQAASLDRLAEVAEMCRDAGTVAALEYMAWTTPSTPEVAVEMASQVDATVVVDVLHHVRVGADKHALALVAKSGRLGWLQLCDAAEAAPIGRDALIREARHERLVPGTGSLPLDALLAAVPPATLVSVEVQSDELVARVPVADRAHLLARAAREVLSRRG